MIEAELAKEVTITLTKEKLMLVLTGLAFLPDEGMDNYIEERGCDEKYFIDLYGATFIQLLSLGNK